MQADAADLGVRAIEVEATVGAEYEAPNPEWRGVVVAERGSAFDACEGPIQVRPVERPQRRPVDHERL